MKEKLSILCIFIFAIAALAGCQQAVPGVTPPDDAINIIKPGQTGTITQNQGTFEEYSFELADYIETKSFKSDEELANFIRDHSGGSYGYYGRGFAGGMMMAKVSAVAETAVMSDMAVPMAAPSPEEGRDFSETNVQVKGVDEADIIKTDGDYIYTISDRVLFIIKAYPGEQAEIISTIKFDNNPESLFIDEDTLAVFGNFYNNDYFRKINFQPRQGMTFMNLYDLSDRSEPKLIKEYKFEGNYFRGRMTGDYAYIITNTMPYYRPEPRPIILDGDVIKHIPVSSIHYYGIPYQSPMFINIHSINMKDVEELNSESIVVEQSQDMYMSNENMYMTYTEYVNEWEIQQDIMMEILAPKLSQADKALIEKIKGTDNEVLSRQEKLSKIFQVYMTYTESMTPEEQDDFQDEAEKMLESRLKQYKYFEYTIINKVNVDDGKITPVANGKVPGHIMNQFSMDEKNDIFRIATTISQRWSRYNSDMAKSSNNVYTLNKDLKILGELDSLAEGEQIYSTRFIDNRLYMVTFRQVDPFFVIDLSDPENPKELGQLKIPGFSRYLHPYDKDTIIGIGQDATETGRALGLKISLFDVSDVQKPKEVAKYVTESRYSGSTALYEHKAFLFSKEKDLLVIPAYSYDGRDSSSSYNGAFVFNISKDDINLRGLIDHSMGTSNMYWQAMVERSLYIEDELYTKSKDLLRINKLDTLEKVKNIELEYKDPKIPIY